MADIDILSMPQAPGLGGGEYIPIVQGGVNKRTTAAAIADLAIVPSAVVWKDQVQYATTVALPTNIYDNGTGGVGATLTAVSNGPLQIDGLFQSMGDRVLIKNETPQANNGIYSVISAGSGSSPWQLERTPDFNQVSLIAPGDAVTVALGTSLAQTFWIETVFVGSVGSSPIIFSELFTPLTAGTGIEINNFVVSIDPSVVATLTGAQTLTNKTLVDPAITGYTASEAVATDVTGAVVTIPNTGTGNNVLAISPVLTTPNLGVPSAIDLTNATNLPIGTLPKGTTDYPLVGNGGLAPSYRQVPIATGVAGLGTGVATFLGTPSSANLATAVTDETGVGSLVFSGSPALTGNPTAPTQTVGDNSTKIATTAYVQAAVSGTTTLPATKYGTIAALPTVTYANGSSGVGATLTATANGALSVDSSSPSVADAILVKNQASTFQNGIYAVTATGDGSNPFVLTRETYYDQSTDIDLGDTTFVTSGTTLAATSWTQNGTENPTVGTNPITFAQTGGPGSFVAGNGISISGTSIAIDTSVTVDKTTAQALSNKTLTTPVINGASTGTGVATAATPNTLMQRGANGNAQANVFVPSYSSTATAAGTTTLTVASTQLQKFTGTTTQTIVLPDVSTLIVGHPFDLNNQSTGAVTVESSGGNVLVVLAPGAFATVNSNSQTGTTAASWDVAQYGIGAAGLLPSARGGVANCSTRSVMAGLDVTRNIVAWLEEGLRQGQFQWSSANLSSQVTSDPAQGVYVPPTSDTSGASGAWVRSGIGNTWHTVWFGLVGSGDETTVVQQTVTAAAGRTLIFDALYGVSSAINLSTNSRYLYASPGCGINVLNGNNYGVLGNGLSNVDIKIDVTSSNVGSSSYVGLITLLNCTNCKVRLCHVTGQSWAGIMVWNSVGCKILHNTIEGAIAGVGGGEAADILIFRNSNNNLILGNDCHGGSLSMMGVMIMDDYQVPSTTPTGNKVIANDVSVHADYGISVYLNSVFDARTVIANNVVYDILGNDIGGSGSYVTGSGIYCALTGAGGVTILGNSVSNCCRDTVNFATLIAGGIVLNMSAAAASNLPVTVSANVINMTFGPGITVSGTAGVAQSAVVSGNDIVCAETRSSIPVGITASNIAKLTISGNGVTTASTTNESILVSQSVSGAITNLNVSNNNVSSALIGLSLSATSGKISGGSVSGNTVISTGSVALRIFDCSNLSITANNCASSTFGILASDLINCSVSGNSLNGSTLEFIGTGSGNVANDNVGIGAVSNGSTAGVQITTGGTAAPSTGTWARGDIVLNTAPAAAGIPGWVCTTSGTPGTWKAMAAIAA